MHLCQVKLAVINLKLRDCLLLKKVTGVLLVVAFAEQ